MTDTDPSLDDSPAPDDAGGDGASAVSEQRSRSDLRREVVLVTLAALGVAKALTLLDIGVIQHNIGTLAAVLWLYTPVAVMMVRKEHPDAVGLTLGPLRPSLLWVGILTVGILVPFYIAYALLVIAYADAVFEVRWPINMWELAAKHILLIGIPEEVFFRGYIQGRLRRLTTRRIRVLGTPVGWELPLAAAIFAGGHVFIEPGLMRAAVFFPALAFGWLRIRTGGVLGAALFHALANVSFIVIQQSLIRLD